MATLAEIQAINDQINTQINAMLDRGDTYAEQAATYSRNEAWMGKIDDLKYNEITIQPFDSNQDFGAEYLATYQGLLDQIGPEFTGLFNSFMNTYFPKQLLADAEAWLSDVFNNALS